MTIIDSLKGKLVVSCQAEAGFPLNTPENLAALAASAVIGGAGAIRASGPANIKAIRQAVRVPIIGIYKQDYPDFAVRITPTIKEVSPIVEAGADILALDATNRPRPDGKTFPELLKSIRDRFDIPIMADISNLQEGLAADRLGVDLVATTLSGYTKADPPSGPDLELVRQLSSLINRPVVAEGRYSTAEEVHAAIEAGAFAVVVGSMITRPHLITKNFVSGLRPILAGGPLLALDIGGTKIAAAIVDGSGQIRVDDIVPTPRIEGGEAVLGAAVNLAKKILNSTPDIEVEAVGISTGGQVDPSGQLIGGTPMLPGWPGLPLRETVSKSLNLPVYVLNDGHAAAIAEARYGAGRGYKSVLCLVIGTGLGGGYVKDGQLISGANGLAGSVGQMKVTRDGKTYVALEDLVSGPALSRAYSDSLGGTDPTLSARDVAQWARQGDAKAQETVAGLGRWLGLGVSHALHTIDAHCVVIGGSVALSGDLLFESARAALHEFGHLSTAATPILPAELGPKAQLVGAALFVRQKEIQ